MKRINIPSTIIAVLMGGMFGGVLSQNDGLVVGSTLGAAIGSACLGLIVGAGSGFITTLVGLASSAPIGALCGAVISWGVHSILGDSSAKATILVGLGCGGLGALLGSLPPYFTVLYVQSLLGKPRGVLPRASIGSETPPQNAWPMLSQAGMRRAIRRKPTHAVNRKRMSERPAIPAKPKPSRTDTLRQSKQAHDTVQCTLFAPREVMPLDFFFLQVFLHAESQETLARTQAVEFDENAVARGARSLGCEMPIGARIMFELSLPGILLEKPVEQLTWQDRAESVQFTAKVPADAPPQVLVGTVLISRDSAPLGHIKFKLTISPSRVPRPAEPIGDEARHYTSAFISYASQDRAMVLPRAQVLKAAGIQCFQDLLSLDPGDRWENKLYHHIEKSDLFLLFWSNNAKRSEWVKKEAMYALQVKGGDEFSPPEIRPVLIEGPPIPEPWRELRHLHFNDTIVYLAALEDQSRPIPTSTAGSRPIS